MLITTKPPPGGFEYGETSWSVDTPANAPRPPAGGRRHWEYVYTWTTAVELDLTELVVDLGPLHDERLLSIANLTEAETADVYRILVSRLATYKAEIDPWVKAVAEWRANWTRNAGESPTVEQLADKHRVDAQWLEVSNRIHRASAIALIIHHRSHPADDEKQATVQAQALREHLCGIEPSTLAAPTTGIVEDS